jgi:hypothetical protein
LFESLAYNIICTREVRERSKIEKLILTAFEDENLPAANKTINVHSPDADAACTKTSPPDSLEIIPAPLQTLPNVPQSVFV